MPPTKPPLVTVVTPAHNAEAFLGDAFESLARQRFRGFEWVVVDDGSVDATARLAAEYAREASFSVRIVTHDVGRGAAGARNAGLAVARGRYVKMLDADDLLEPGHLAVQVAAIARAGEASVVSPVELLMYSPGRAPVRLGGDALALPAAADDLLAACLSSDVMSHCGCLFHRAHLVALGGYAEDLTTDEDGWLLLDYLLRGHRFVAELGTRYTYRVPVDVDRANLASDDAPAMIESRYQVVARARAALTAQGRLTRFAEPLAQRLDHVAMRAVIRYPELAERYFAEAEALYPGYQRYGSPNYRRLRRWLPPARARRVFDGIQRLRARYGR